MLSVFFLNKASRSSIKYRRKHLKMGVCIETKFTGVIIVQVDLNGFNGDWTHGRTKEQFFNNQRNIQNQSFRGMLKECLGEQEIVDDAKERNSVASRMLEANFMPRLVKR